MVNIGKYLMMLSFGTTIISLGITSDHVWKTSSGTMDQGQSKPKCSF